MTIDLGYLFLWLMGALAIAFERSDSPQSMTFGDVVYFLFWPIAVPLILVVATFLYLLSTRR